MFSLWVLVLLFASCQQATAGNGSYSFSLTVGRASGSPFETVGSGRITGIKVWEIPGAYIAGIQVRFGYIWSKSIGRLYGVPQELNLRDGETIVQISGRYHTNYIFELIFMTSTGRFMKMGQPSTRSFNFYPQFEKAELIKLSGTYTNAGITSLAAHWGIPSSNSTST